MTRDGQKHNKMWLLAVALLLPLLAAAQEPADSIDVAPLPQSQEQRALADSFIASPVPNVALNVDSLAAAAVAAIRPRTFHPDPIRSQWVSMVLPGGGQIYNRKFWKLPIIYGGFLGCAYALSWNGQMLRYQHCQIHGEYPCCSHSCSDVQQGQLRRRLFWRR